MIDKQQIKISVKELVEFIMRRGNLDNRFVGNNRALEGTKAHRKVQNLYKQEHEIEVSLKHEIEIDEFVIIIEGRIDGVLEENNEIIIDEIKSTRVSLESIDENHNLLHWAQAKCYAYMYAEKENLNEILVRLTYYNLDTNEIKYFQHKLTLKELKDFFYSLIDAYYIWAKLTLDWTAVRNTSIKNLLFPFAEYRKGQRQLAVAVYKTILADKKLYVQAPTGIGKTISTIFPAIKAMGEGYTSKIFYLTPKTTTRSVVEETFAKLRNQGLEIKTCTITAKDKICFKEKSNCNPEYCHYANGHFDRVNNAVINILREEQNYTREIIKNYAEKYQVCPFELSLDLALWSDVIVCDYNYVFDPSVYLKRFFVDKSNDFTFLIDEAHNLADRAREMFSAELFKKPFLKLKRLLKNKDKKFEKNLRKINYLMLELKKSCGQEGYNILDQVPKDIYSLLKEFIDNCEEFLSRFTDKELYEEVLELYFSVNAFLRTLEVFDESFRIYVEEIDWDMKLKLFCLDPSNLLGEALKRGRAAVFFSATLMPIEYFREILGGNNEDNVIYLKSPFSIDNRCLLVADNVSTKYTKRRDSYSQIINYLKLTVESKAGNYIVFFPSYQYMNSVYNLLIEDNSNINVYIQKPSMSEDEKEDFLNLFKPNQTEYTLVFSVLGGVFSEGIDLKHERLIGVIIVGVGLPQICLERNLIKSYFDIKNSLGYEYAYIYPGMNKVLQAAGRVIRTESDKGVILLIDERYSRGSYKRLFPSDWFSYGRVNGINISKFLMKFWDLHE